MFDMTRHVADMLMRQEEGMALGLACLNAECFRRALRERDGARRAQLGF